MNIKNKILEAIMPIYKLNNEITFFELANLACRNKPIIYIYYRDVLKINTDHILDMISNDIKKIIHENDVDSPKKIIGFDAIYYNILYAKSNLLKSMILDDNISSSLPNIISFLSPKDNDSSSKVDFFTFNVIDQSFPISHGDLINKLSFSLWANVNFATITKYDDRLVSIFKEINVKLGVGLLFVDKFNVYNSKVIIEPSYFPTIDKKTIDTISKSNLIIESFFIDTIKFKETGFLNDKKWM